MESNSTSTNKEAWIYDFKSVQPTHTTRQEDIAHWLKSAHAYAEQNHLNTFSNEELERRIDKYYCSSEKISRRNHMLEDFLHTDWSQMEVFNLSESPYGRLMGTRMKVFEKYSSIIFEQLYANQSEGPDHLIHVTCTGYNAPSSAQQMVAKKGWNQKTTVSHAYHMGCLAALPALRIARSYFMENSHLKIDVAHTEICSLHMNPLGHEPEDIIGQSLFADGFIKYRIGNEPPNASLQLLALHEEIIPDTIEKMKWQPTDWGMQFVLSKEIPVLILRVLRSYLKKLAEKSMLSLEMLIKEAIFAIHPGGPKIIDYIQRELSLTDEQVAASSKILFENGNISSATLPHIWNEIACNSRYSARYIVTLGFGPGLTISGAVLRKP